MTKNKTPKREKKIPWHRSDSYEVYTQDLLDGFTTSVWIFNRSTPEPSVVSIEKGMMVLNPVKEGKSPEPTLRVNYDVWQEIKHAMIDEKVRDKNEVESELKATKYHLEDLRKLLKI